MCRLLYAVNLQLGVFLSFIKNNYETADSLYLYFSVFLEVTRLTLIPVAKPVKNNVMDQIKTHSIKDTTACNIWKFIVRNKT